jgi:hypothetical protein
MSGTAWPCADFSITIRQFDRIPGVTM